MINGWGRAVYRELEFLKTIKGGSMLRRAWRRFKRPVQLTLLLLIVVFVAGKIWGSGSESGEPQPAAVATYVPRSIDEIPLARTESDGAEAKEFTEHERVELSPRANQLARKAVRLHASYPGRVGKRQLIQRLRPLLTPTAMRNLRLAPPLQTVRVVSLANRDVSVSEVEENNSGLTVTVLATRRLRFRSVATGTFSYQRHLVIYRLKISHGRSPRVERLHVVTGSVGDG